MSIADGVQSSQRTAWAYISGPFSIPKNCPVCGEPFDSAVHKAAQPILKAFKDLIDSEKADQIVFRMTTPERIGSKIPSTQHY